MSNPADTAAAIVQALGTASFGHIEVAGGWLGPVFQSFEGGNATFTDSRLVENAGSKEPAALYGGFDEAPGLVLQRSVVQAPPTAHAALESIDGNVTIDSSEVLGGGYGVLFDQSAGRNAADDRRLDDRCRHTGPRGPHRDGRVRALGAGPTVSHAKALIEGTIVFEGALAEHGAGSTAQLACRHSNVPQPDAGRNEQRRQHRVRGGQRRQLTSATPESLFATPITSYALSPPPAPWTPCLGAITLPFGLTPRHRPRGQPALGRRDRLRALQDEGALELQGRSVPCPPAPAARARGAAKPLAGVISALSISPSSFYPAPSGATISRASKKKYGAKITYRDSQAATTTFTVLRESAGRTAGPLVQEALARATSTASAAPSSRRSAASPTPTSRAQTPALQRAPARAQAPRRRLPPAGGGPRCRRQRRRRQQGVQVK